VDSSRKPREIEFLHNTVHNYDIVFVRAGLADFQFDNLVKNNIFTNVNNGIWSEDLELTDLEIINTWFDNNFYDVSGSWTYSYTEEIDYATWQSVRNQDLDSIRGTDVLYVDEANGDFRLQAGSPAENLAVDILDLDGDGSTTDFVPAGAFVTGDETVGLIDYNRSSGIGNDGSNCGDGYCDGAETCSSCVLDCGDCPAAVCGDLNCTGLENCSTCPGDCGNCSCVHEAELDPCDGAVSIAEISSYINQWRSGAVSIGDVLVAINVWRAG